jgi:hypothetical protein
MMSAARLVRRFKAALKAPRQLGEEAFAKGLKAVPAHDPALMKWIKENAGPGVTLKALKEWTKGWNAGNLKAPV